MNLRVLLLDVDGTLVDSNDQHARAWVDVFAEGGDRVPYEAVRALVGMGGDKLVQVFNGLSPDEPRSRELRDRRKELFAARYLGSVRPFPGARALVERAARVGLKRVVATSASTMDLERLLEIAEVKDLIDEATSADDVAASKPEPDIVQCALQKVGCEPREAVLLGDTPWDLAAATRAGVAMVALRCGGWSDAELRSAAAIFDDPADLLRRWEASPFARPRRAG